MVSQWLLLALSSEITPDGLMGHLRYEGLVDQVHGKHLARCSISLIPLLFNIYTYLYI